MFTPVTAFVLLFQLTLSPNAYIKALAGTKVLLSFIIGLTSNESSFPSNTIPLAFLYANPETEDKQIVSKINNGINLFLFYSFYFR